MSLSYSAQFEIRRRTPSDIFQHLPFMHEAACAYSEPMIIELGVRTGNSTSAWLAAVEKRGGHIWSVDIEEPRVPQSWRECEAWTLTVADDRDDDVIRFITEKTRPGADVLFIDTSHEYEHTIAELDAYVPMLRPGGIVLMHDTDWMDMAVRKALDWWCDVHGISWENRPGCNGLGVIRIGAS